MDRDTKDCILDAALRAPTAGNMMLYSMLEIEDQSLKEKLIESCDNQPFIGKAPFAVIFLADYQRTWDYFLSSNIEEYCREQGRELRRPGEGDFLLACNDALIAAQTSVITAESMGLGSCYIGDIMENYEFHRDLLDLPDYVFPVTMVCYGYPKPEHLARKPVPRFSREFIHHKDSYRSLGPDDFERMYSPWLKECGPAGGYRKGASNFGQHMYARKFDSDFSREMSRSVRAALKFWESRCD